LAQTIDIVGVSGNSGHRDLVVPKKEKFAKA